MKPKCSRNLLACVTVLFLIAAASLASAAETQNPAELRKGKTFIETKVYSQEEDLKTLELFKGLWKDTKHYTHRIIGIAVTARYVPTNRAPAGRRSVEDYDKWAGHWYSTYSSEPFVSLIRKGTVLVIEDASNVDVGSIGSNNIMGWTVRGCLGVVTSATARDTDEIITEKVPLYFKKPGRGIRPGRNEIESVNRPIVCGGVLVMPGDVIVADGDGVIVVPRQHAEEVAAYAQKIIEGDKAGRRSLYKRLGLPEDDSVR
jgi:4-hydroxy-4-methyl-2-oxoglutarate aldolase